MKIIIVLCLSMLCAQNTIGQQQTLVKQWDKRFGGTSHDVLYAIIQTTDGGYLLGGWSQSGANGDKTQPNWDTTMATADYWIVKVDSVGNKQWDQRYGGTDDDILSSLQQTTDGGYILGGTSYSGANGDKTQPSWGGADYWIVKIDSIGNQQWDKRFGGTNNDGLISLQQTSDKGYILGGLSNSGISGDKTQNDWDTTLFTDDYWIVKVDSLGNKQWDKRYGGTQEDAFSYVSQTVDGGYIVGGTSSSDSSGDRTMANLGFADCWIVKIDSIGNQQWDNAIFGGGNIYKIYQIVNNKYIVIGAADMGYDGYDTIPTGGFCLAQLDSIAKVQWVRTFPEGYGVDAINSLVTTFDGGYLMATYSFAGAGGNKSENNLGTPQTWVIKTDSGGVKQWDKTIFTLGNDIQSGYAIQCADGNYLVGNYTGAPVGGYKTQPNWDTTDGTYDYWIVKMNDTLLSGISTINDSVAVSVYPNPFAADISIMVQKQSVNQASFTINDILGNRVFYKEESNIAAHYTKMLDLSYLPNGIYLLEVVVDGERMVQKIVKQ